MGSSEVEGDSLGDNTFSIGTRLPFYRVRACVVSVCMRQAAAIHRLTGESNGRQGMCMMVRYLLLRRIAMISHTQAQEGLFSEGLVDADEIGVDGGVKGVNVDGLLRKAWAGFFEALEVVVGTPEMDVGGDVAGVEGEGGFEGGDDLFVASERKESEGRLFCRLGSRSLR